MTFASGAMGPGSRRWWWLGGASSVALLLALWWWSSLPVDVQLEAPVADAPEPSPPVRAVVVSAADASVGQPGAQKEEETLEHRSSTVWTSLGPSFELAPDGLEKPEFERACIEEGEACVGALAGRDPPVNIFFDLGGDDGGRHVVGFTHTAQEGDAFEKCVLRGMKLHVFKNVFGPFDACSFVELRAKYALNPRLTDSITRCLENDASAEAISLTAIAQLQGGQLSYVAPEVTALGRLDPSKERCIRLAVRDIASPVDEEHAARFRPYRETLTVVLTTQSNQRSVDLGEVKTTLAVTGALKPDPPATADERENAARLAGQVEAAMRRSAREASELAGDCLVENPGELRCHRVLALAWLALATDEPGSRERAVVAWLKFLKRAPADDPDVKRLKVALIAAGWSE